MDSPEEQQPIEPGQSAPQDSSGRRRRGRRGGRGRNRGHRRPAQTEQSSGAPLAEQAVPELEASATAGRGKDSSAMSRAVDEVRQIVESLEQVLEQMEEVHELVEAIERQKSADEREIESLRRTLRRIQHPRAHKESHHEQGS